MIFDQTTAFGIVASALTTLSLLPQLIKIIKEKKSKDISVFMLFILLVGFACWIYYGVLKEDIVIIGANILSFFLNSILVILSIHYKKNKN